MKIVVDVGCARYGQESSVDRLLERYEPDLFYGFDPNSERLEMVRTEFAGNDSLSLSNAAAWVHDGEVLFVEGGLRSRISMTQGDPVPCIDLARFIRELPLGEIILKLDCEGAEIPLLNHLHDTEADALLSLCLVEWHCENCGTGGGQHTASCSPQRRSVPKVTNLRCPVETWAL